MSDYLREKYPNHPSLRGSVHAPFYVHGVACRICGDTDRVAHRFHARQALCDRCSASTPEKVSRLEFERVYWKGEAQSVPRRIRDSFWSDYVASTHTLAAYIAATTDEA